MYLAGAEYEARVRERKRRGRRLSVLRAAESNIQQKIEDNDKQVEEGLMLADTALTEKDAVRMRNYVEDLQRITLLLHSLARRLGKYSNSLELK